jgi:hypothetical protein
MLSDEETVRKSVFGGLRVFIEKVDGEVAEMIEMIIEPFLKELKNHD